MRNGARREQKKRSAGLEANSKDRHSLRRLKDGGPGFEDGETVRARVQGRGQSLGRMRQSVKPQSLQIQNYQRDYCNSREVAMQVFPFLQGEIHHYTASILGSSLLPPKVRLDMNLRGKRM